MGDDDKVSYAQLYRGLHCHFCGRAAEEAGRLIKGIGHTYICEDCVDEICRITKMDWYAEKEA